MPTTKQAPTIDELRAVVTDATAVIQPWKYEDGETGDRISETIDLTLQLL